MHTTARSVVTHSIEIGTVGHLSVGFPYHRHPANRQHTHSHIGICKCCTCVLVVNAIHLDLVDTRILLTLLMDKDARPAPKDMKLWVDVVRYVKRGAAGGALSFFTYMELSKLAHDIFDFDVNN
jgi:hypothetical protein